MGGVFQLFGEGVGISSNWVTAHFLILTAVLELSWPLWVSHLACCCVTMSEAQGLVEVDLSAILEAFGSNQFMSCPRAMSFFQGLCPAPFPPVSIIPDIQLHFHRSNKSFFGMSHILHGTYQKNYLLFIRNSNVTGHPVF